MQVRMKGLLKKIKESLQIKLQLFILSSAFVVFLLIIIYISITTREMALNDAKRMTEQMALNQANIIEGELNKDFSLTHTLAKSFEDFILFEDTVRNQVVPSMLKRVFEHNSHIQSIWMHWELNAIQKNYTNTHGRVRLNFYRVNGDIKFKLDTADINKTDNEGLYYQIKQSKNNVITEPYWYSYTDHKEDEMFESSICVPVLQSTRFLGLMGIDLVLERFEGLVKDIKPYKGSYAFFVSNKGTFIYHPDAVNLGKNLITDNPEANNKYHFNLYMQKGDKFSFERNDGGGRYFVTFAPVYVGDTQTPWYLSLVVPFSEMVAKANQNMLDTLLIGLLGIIILGFVLYLIARNMSRPLIHISDMLEELSKGILHSDNTISIKTKDEIGTIALAMNDLKLNLSQTAEFAEEIGKGNLNVEFKKLSEEDVLGNALLNMRESLVKAEQDDKIRKKQDEIQRWIGDGLAKINELMRQHNELNVLSYKVVELIVNYLNANQGSLYILNDDNAETLEDRTFEASSALAWGRKKPHHRKIKMGESLIGRAAYEQSTLHMTEIPEDYVNITSGLGKATPRALLIVPLILNEEVMGVIEIVSFNIFEKHHIEFVERAGESIASSIASLKISQRTSRLLDQTKSQAGELTEKEEELRQQMEEMQATQEEAAKREAEMTGMITAINSIAYVAEFSMDGYIISVNDAYAKLLELPKQQILGKKQGFFEVGEDEGRMEAFEQLWAKMRKGIPHKQEQKIEINNKERWLSEVYTPIKDNEGVPVRVINIAMDITHLKRK
jgi:methyl-accepting chemotaxis protein